MNSRPRVPKILFNCSTNVAGGGVQNAANFIWHAAQDARFDWYFAVSPQVNDVLQKWDVRPEALRVFESPARSSAGRKALRAFENDNHINLVYTMAGPTYVRFGSRHVLGISNPYITHASWESFVIGRSAVQIARSVPRVFLRGLIARCEADHWIFQTDTSRRGFCRRFRVQCERTFVVANAVGQAFVTSNVGSQPATKSEGPERKVRIFCPAADYPHKNLRIIPKVAQILSRKGGSKYCFTLTIPNQSRVWEDIRIEARGLGVEGLIENIGPFSYVDAKGLYSEADIVFMPSILETFSTSYLEAVVAMRPLVAADRSFAREICGDSATYFDPTSAEDAARAIQLAEEDVGKVDKLTHFRDWVLRTYGSYGDRYRTIVDVLTTILRTS